MNKNKLKNDILLAIGLTVICLSVSVFFLFSFKDGGVAYVKQDGKVTAQYPLNEDVSVEILSGGGGKNLLVIKGGKAFIENADCPDKICVKHRAVSKTGETIVCIPNRLVIEIGE